MTMRGRKPSAMSSRRGLLLSRFERTGSVIPHSAATAGIVPGQAQLVGVVVVTVDQVPQQEVGQGGEAVGHAGRDEQALVDVPVEVDQLGGPVGGRALPQVVQHHPRPSPQEVPVVGLVQVVVQPHQRARLLLGSVALHHLPAEGEPAAPVGLDEAASLVAVHVRDGP